MENNTATPQKKKNKAVSIIIAIFAGILIIIELTLPNFGFSLEIGGNVWALLVYIVGGKLIYDAFKTLKK